MKIATGEIEESGQTHDGKNKAAVALGSKGGKARAKKLGVRRRKEIARAGALDPRSLSRRLLVSWVE
jgi:hypothetical protein